MSCQVLCLFSFKLSPEDHGPSGLGYHVYGVKTYLCGFAHFKGNIAESLGPMILKLVDVFHFPLFYYPVVGNVYIV